MKKQRKKTTKSEKSIQNDLVYEIYLVLSNTGDFYNKVCKRIKENKNKIITLAEFDRLVATGYNQYVHKYIEPKNRKYIGETVFRTVSRQLRADHMEELEFERKYNKK